MKYFIYSIFFLFISIPLAVAQTDESRVLSVDIQFHADAGANATFTNQAVAETLFVGSNRHITKYDLSNFTRCRLLTYVVTASASVNTPRIVARYSTTSQTTVGGFTSELGTTAISQSIFTGTTGLQVTPWTTIAAAARGDVWLALVGIGGNAVADPAFGSVMLQCR